MREEFRTSLEIFKCKTKQGTQHVPVLKGLVLCRTFTFSLFLSQTVLPSAAADVLRPDQIIFMYPQLGET